MNLSVSNYEELLDQVRELTHETIILQDQLASDLFNTVDPADVNHNLTLPPKNYEKGNFYVYCNVILVSDSLSKIN